MLQLEVYLGYMDNTQKPDIILFGVTDSFQAYFINPQKLTIETCVPGKLLIKFSQSFL